MRYSFNEGIMFMDVADGVALVINSETGIYYGMNAFGSAVFEALTKGVDTDDAAAALKALAGAPADMEERFARFVEALVGYRILVPGEGDAAAAFDAASAAADDFTLEVNAFDDAWEMLMADPIHEVKEETGWTPDKVSIGYTKEETKEREKKIQ